MAKLLSAEAVGSTVKINENGSPVDYLVLQQGNPDTGLYDESCDGTWVLRTALWDEEITFGTVFYDDSSPNLILNREFFNLLDENFKPYVKQVKIPYVESFGGGIAQIATGENGLSCHVFLLSIREVGIRNTDTIHSPNDGAKLSYFEYGNTETARKKRIAQFNERAEGWWLRSIYTANDNQAFTILSSGDPGPRSKENYYYMLPAMILPGTLSVSDDGTIIVPPLAPDSIAVPDTTMQGNTLPVSWTAVDGADSYVLERSADSGAWTQVYSGAGLSYTDTAGAWSTVQYRVKAGASGVYGDYTTSAAVAVVPASTCTISGEDGDLGTLTGDIMYTAMTSTSEPITVTETVNGTVLRTFQPVSGAQQRISVMDLPTGGGTAVIKAECSGVSVTRTWTYTKAAADFPAAGTPFDIALLSKGGRVQFPQTLAECVRMPGGERLGDVLSTRIGDTLTTARKDLGSSWLLCNGDLVSKEQYPELWDVLSKSQEAEGIESIYTRVFMNSAASDKRYCKGIAYGNGYYVMGINIIGKPNKLGIYYSDDKINWIYKELASDSSAASSYRVRFINGYFLLCTRVNAFGYIYYTQDPSGEWTEINFGTIGDVIDIIYAKGSWIICNNTITNGSNRGINIYSSTDITIPGAQWTKQSVSLTSDDRANSIAFINEYFVICGNGYDSNYGNYPKFWYTKNFDNTWGSKQLTHNNGRVCGIIFDSKQYVMFGISESIKATIWYGTDLENLTRSTISTSFKWGRFSDGISRNGLSILVAENDDTNLPGTALYYFYGGISVEELPNSYIDLGKYGSSYISSDDHNFIVGSGDDDSDLSFFEVWDKKFSLQLPEITNDRLYTYIKARKGS